MKISKNCHRHNFEFGNTYKLWSETAQKISLQTGICITVNADFPNISHNISIDGMVGYDRIYFKINDHEFENLAELKTAIKNKAFL